MEDPDWGQWVPGQQFVKAGPLDHALTIAPRQALSGDRSGRSRTRRTIIGPRDDKYDAVARGDLAGAATYDVRATLSGY